MFFFQIPVADFEISTFALFTNFFQPRFCSVVAYCFFFFESNQVLSNKALVLSRHSADVDLLAKALCALITDPTLNNPETLRNAPARFSRSEFQQFVFRVLTCLASYHAHLKPEVQQKLVKCLEVGLKFKGNHPKPLFHFILLYSMSETSDQCLFFTATEATRLDAWYCIEVLRSISNRF